MKPEYEARKETDMLGEARKILILLLGLLAVFALAGCSSEKPDAPAGEEANGGAKEHPPTPLETVRLAYESTAESGSARFSMRSETTGLPQQEGMPEQMTMTGSGIEDFQSGDTRMVMRMPMLGEMEMRVAAKTAYMRFPEQLLAQVAPGKSWVEMDYEQMMRDQYGAGASEMQGAQQDPTRQLEYLRSVSDSVEEVGKEEVRDVPTTRYRAIVDLEKAVPDDPQAREAYEKMVEQTGQTRIPVHVWLDGEDRVRRYEMTMDVPVPTGTASSDATDKAQTTMTIEYFDFGVPVNVTPPPPEETIPYEELMARQQTAAPA